MKDRSLLLNTAIDSEFLITTSNWNQSLNAEEKFFFVTASSTIECWYTVCPSPKGLMTFWNQIS